MSNTALHAKRLVTVAIPDRDEHEATIRYAADRLNSDLEIMVIDLPREIPPGWRPQLYGELTERAQAVGAAARKAFASVTATITGPKRE